MGDNLIKTRREKAEHNRRNRTTKKNRQKSRTESSKRKYGYGSQTQADTLNLITD